MAIWPKTVAQAVTALVCSIEEIDYKHEPYMAVQIIVHYSGVLKHMICGNRATGYLESYFDHDSCIHY